LALAAVLKDVILGEGAGNGMLLLSVILAAFFAVYKS